MTDFETEWPHLLNERERIALAASLANRLRDSADNRAIFTAAAHPEGEQS